MGRSRDKRPLGPFRLRHRFVIRPPRTTVDRTADGVSRLNVSAINGNAATVKAPIRQSAFNRISILPCDLGRPQAQRIAGPRIELIGSRRALEPVKSGKVRLNVVKQSAPWGYLGLSATAALLVRNTRKIMPRSRVTSPRSTACSETRLSHISGARSPPPGVRVNVTGRSTSAPPASGR
jgi:hypothetical protein